MASNNTKPSNDARKVEKSDEENGSIKDPMLNMTASPAEDDVSNIEHGTQQLKTSEGSLASFPDEMDSLANAIMTVDVRKVTLDYENYGVILRPDRSMVSRYLSRDSAMGSVNATLEKRDAYIEAFSEQVDVMLELKAPREVVLNKDKVSKSPSARKFPNTVRVLGTGRSSGQVIVLEDENTKEKYARKTIMISEFNKDHIKTWVHMSDQGLAPELYSFSLEANRVVFKQEVIEGKDLTDVVKELFQRKDASHLIRPFALVMLKDLISSYNHMLSQGFTHGDLHGGNVRLTRDLQMKILDFGSARHLQNIPDGQQKESHILHDIIGIIRIFVQLCSGNDFPADDIDNQQTIDLLKTDSLCKLNKRFHRYGLTKENRKEMYYIIMKLFGCVQDPRQEGFGTFSIVQDVIAKKCQEENISQDYIKRSVAVICFEEFQDDGHDADSESDDTGHECGEESDDDESEEEEDLPGIWDHPKMERYMKNVTDAAMKRMGIFF